MSSKAKGRDVKELEGVPGSSPGALTNEIKGLVAILDLGRRSRMPGV